jgi:hypothetical protein
MRKTWVTWNIEWHRDPDVDLDRRWRRISVVGVCTWMGSTWMRVRAAESMRRMWRVRAMSWVGRMIGVCESSWVRVRGVRIVVCRIGAWVPSWMGVCIL